MRKVSPKFIRVLFLVFMAFLVLAGAEGDSCNPMVDPAVEYRPWARWWWPGNDVDDAELQREVKLLADMGFGGVEIQAFTMGLDPQADPDEMARRMSYDTPEFYRHLAVVMDAAQEANLGVDLNLGSGWPSGGAHISPEQGLKTLLWSEKTVRGPGRKKIKLDGPAKPVAYTVMGLAEKLLHTPVMDWRGGEAELVEVVAGRVTGGHRSINPFNFNDQLELDPDSIVALTDRVDENGALEWDAPAGKWVVIAVYQAPEGERPTLSAQDPAGYVVDHFNADAARYNLDHLLGPRTGLPPYYGAPLRAFFNDSFEFKTERHWSNDFFAEFQARRGYDLKPYLPAVLIPGGDDFFLEFAGHRSSDYSLGELDQRLQYDYALTVSDLFIERYLDAAAQWAHDRGLSSRAQGYGLDIDVIRAPGHADIPETEQLYAGGSSMFLKIASSGACLYNRPVVSAESMVWSGRDYLTTPLKIKAAADKLFAAGINHVIYHGYSYRKDGPEYGETGWFPWSSPFSPAGFSSNLSEANPYWKYLKKINLYLSRCQYLLRQGKPDYDLLVYYPFLGFPSSFSNVSGHDEPLFTGRFDHEPEVGGDSIQAFAKLVPGTPASDPRIEWLSAQGPRLHELEAAGYTWIWVNDESLAEAEFKDGKIEIRGNRFQAVVLLDAPWLGAAAAERLAGLFEQGAVAAVWGTAPGRAPGRDRDNADQKVRESLARVMARAPATGLAGPPALEAQGVAPGIQYRAPSPGLSQFRVGSGEGDLLVFFCNTTDRPVALEFARDRFQRESWLDPWSLGEDEPVDHVLPPFGSVFWMGEVAPGDGPAPSGEIGPGLKVSRSIPLPLRADDTVEDGPVYRAQVNLDQTAGVGFMLETDWVAGAAEVRVNGREAGAWLVPSDRIDITELAADGANDIEIRIIPPLRNHLIKLAAGRDQRYKQFRKKPALPPDPEPLGPVRVVVIGEKKGP